MIARSAFGRLRACLPSVLAFCCLCLFPAADGSGSTPIDHVVSAKKHMAHVVDSLDLLLYVCLLILTIVTLWIFKQHRVRYLHESGLAVIYGLVVGFLLTMIGGSTRSLTRLHVQPVETVADEGSGKHNRIYDVESPPDQLLLAVNVTTPVKKRYRDTTPQVNMFAYVFSDQMSKSSADLDPIAEKATFNPELFFYVLLPPIIFYAGYSMSRRQLFDNIGAIIVYALAGTAVSTFIIGIIMYGFGLLLPYIEVKFIDALFFGAVVSATDPVTVLAIFNDLNADPALYSLVLGESLLNDAVAMVLSNAIEEYGEMAEGGDMFDPNLFFLTLVKFFSIMFGSVGLGGAIGSLTSIMTKFTRLQDFPLLETTLFSLMSYTSYLFAEICELSGIVSVLFCGIFQAHYTYHNLSAHSKKRTKELFETLNFLAENFIFSYLGVSMFTFSRHLFDVVFICGAFVAILLARLCNIYPLTFLVNLGRNNKIPLNFQHMLWFSGLRGAMAFALAVQNTVTPVRQMFFTTTCLISIVTVIFLGGLTTPALALFKFCQIHTVRKEKLVKTDITSAA